ncbi:hypothetical protein KUV51_03860 [Tateyamaria omphalii]|uniref:hypothetical protein n=1 Tax=Tateyamaria omphalii TaxID=299262 RepID=UPI001C9A11FB|nr:hypothetical protein [Tateyamaria omphalii]MBY5932123.1 hypothetical protein [Tateyamaria omphalii]
MSLSVRIFSHAVSMVFRDFSATIRATWVGLAVLAIGSAILFVVEPGLATGMTTLEDPFTDSSVEVRDMNFGLIFPAVLMLIVGYIMMIAAWHRFVLLPHDRRHEGFTPSAGIVLGYLGRSILLGIVIVLLAIPLFIPVGLVAAGAGDVVAGFAAIPFVAVLGWLFFRWSLILPACTIGHKMTFRESWDATKPLAATIFGLMIILAVVDFILNLAADAILTDNIVSALIAVIGSLLYALVSASILTTLYGIAVEGRDV